MSDRDPFDLQPTLRGEFLTLRPLASEDFDALYAVASDPLIWEQHPDTTRHQRPVFEKFFAAALASGGTLVVTGNDSGAFIGSSRYYDWDPARREVAIGYTFLARSHWGGAANREMKRLMLDHAFRWADTVWFHVGTDNHRSRRALEKIGARLSHVSRRMANGLEQDYAYYRIDTTRVRPAGESSVTKASKMSSCAYVWEFRVEAGRREEFERHYGPDGTWARLFRRADGYLGTLLLQDPADRSRYLTIDRWESRSAHRAFRARFAAEYEALDRQCEALTARETAIGEFTELRPP